MLAETPSRKQIKLVNEGISLTGSVPLDLLRQHFRALHGDDHNLVQNYLSVRRKVLDNILVNAAVDAKVEVRTGCAVESLVIDGDRVAGIVGRTKAGTAFKERAPIVVVPDPARIAAGIREALARPLMSA